MNIIKPKKLKKGDLISIIAPCGDIDENYVQNGVKFFEKLGYRVKLGKHVFDKYRYMAGLDEDRSADINDAFEDDDVDMILCARGGYGAIRLIDKINYDIIAKNPKIFCGYSDVSLLSAIILKRTGLITFSSPMVKGDFQECEINDYTIEHFFSTLTSDEITLTPVSNKVYRSGICEGIMFGGNLATITSLCGIDFIPDDKFIFFAEDLNEPVYKIDKYFNQLLNIDKFRNNISGIVLGDFLSLEDEPMLDELFKEISDRLKIPVYGGYAISHSKQKATIPYGGFAALNSEKLVIKI